MVRSKGIKLPILGLSCLNDIDRCGHRCLPSGKGSRVVGRWTGPCRLLFERSTADNANCPEDLILSDSSFCGVALQALQIAERC